LVLSISLQALSERGAWSDCGSAGLNTSGFPYYLVEWAPWHHWGFAGSATGTGRVAEGG